MPSKQIKYKLSEIDSAVHFILNNSQSPVLLFKAPMGSGKTTLIGNLLKKISPDEFLGSPTFSLVNEYTSFEGNPVYHFDLYRLKTPEELLDLGFEEYLEEAEKIFIEWPEKAWEYLPAHHDLIHIKPLENDIRILQIIPS